MKRTLPLYTLLLCLCLFSCDSKPKEESKQTNKNEVIDHSTSQNSLDYTGVYQGKLPCADCESIQIKLAINEDNTFVKSTVYVGESPEIFTETGTYNWNTTGTSIYLENEAGEKQGYVVKENNIVMLDQDGNIIKGELAEMYILHKIE